MHPVLLDAAGHRRQPVTLPGYHAGRPPRNKGRRYPADPPTVEEIIAVMRTAGGGPDGVRLRALIVVLWRAGLRIGEALALAETDLDARRGAVLVRHGKVAICCAQHMATKASRRFALMSIGVHGRLRPDLSAGRDPGLGRRIPRAGPSPPHSPPPPRAPDLCQRQKRSVRKHPGSKRSAATGPRAGPPGSRRRRHQSSPGCSRA
jgi:integrase